MQEFINPNWHIILIHYPLGLLLVGVLIEAFAFLWRTSTFRVAGRWMILLGALSMVPTVLTGIYALHDVVLMNNPVDEYATWNERIVSSPLTHEQWSMLQTHLWMEVGAASAAILAVLIWLGSSDRVRDKLYYPCLAVLIVSVGVMVAGAWFSGEAVYRHQVATGVSETPNTEDDEDAEGAAFFAPPLELHLTLAGAALALVLASIGLAYRTAAVANEAADRAIEDAAEQAQEPSEVDSLVRSINPDALLSSAPSPATTTVPAARFWLLAALLLLLTALAGAWYLATESETWDVQTLWLTISDDPDNLRRLAHVIGGASLLVLALAMACLARWAPRRRGWLTLLTALLVLVAAAQVWLGLLLLFDSPTGPLTRINNAPHSIEAPSAAPTSP